MAIYDKEMVKTFYETYREKVSRFRSVMGRPLTYAEKILGAHLAVPATADGFRRGASYGLFHPNRVCMQDATAQMAVLQFMNSGRSATAVPTTIHCDHLIRARRGAAFDGTDLLRHLPRPRQRKRTVRSMTSSLPPHAAMAWASGVRGQASSTKSFWKTMLSPAA